MQPLAREVQREHDARALGMSNQPDRGASERHIRTSPAE